MAFNKFLEIGGGDVNLTDGSQVIIAKTLGAANLDASSALKTNAVGTIITTDLLISDTTGLAAALAAGSGDMDGPASSVDNRIPLFDGTTGKLLKDSSVLTLNSSGDILRSGSLWIHEPLDGSNIFINSVGGGSMTSAVNCIAIGQNALLNATSCQSCIAIGDPAVLSSLTEGDDNISIGGGSSAALTEGSNNVCVGKLSMLSVVTGDNNICLGVSSGSNLTLADSDNILLNNSGQAGDVGQIKIGNSTDHDVITFKDSLQINSSNNLIAPTQFTIQSTANVADAIQLLTASGSSQTIQILNSTGLNSTEAIDILASSGGISLHAPSTQGDMVIACGGVMAIQSSAGSAVAIDLGANGVSGGVNIFSTLLGTKLTSTGPILIDSNLDAADAIMLFTDAGSNETIALKNSQGTSSDAVELLSIAGGIQLTSATTTAITSTGVVTITSSADAADSIQLLVNSGSSETIALKNVQGTAADSIELTSSAGGIQLSANTTMVIASSTTGNIQSTELMNIGSTAEGLNLFSQSNGTVITSLGPILIDANSTDEDSFTIDCEGDINLDALSEVHIPHTATVNDETALVVDVNAAGFGNIKGLNLTYQTGNISGGSDEECIIVNVDQSASSGGHVTGFEMVGTSTGSANLTALEVGIQIDPLIHQVGIFVDADSILVVAVDQLTALSQGGGGSISIFVLDNDIFVIGLDEKFSELEFILGTVASGAGIAPTFEFSTGVGSWTVFSPADGTSGMRSSGVIIWEISDISGWMTGLNTEYLIRITRTRNTVNTVPIADLVQVSNVISYGWDLNADVSMNSISLLETDGGLDTIKIQSPSTLAASYTLTLPVDDGNVDEFLQTNGSGVLDWAVHPLPIGYIDQLIISDNSTSLKSISAGSCRSNDDADNLVFAGGTVNMATTGSAGGLDTGSEASDTWYSIWIIGIGSGSVSTLLSLSATSPTLPTNYTRKRRIGWVRNDSSSDFLDYLVIGNRERRYTYRESTAATRVLGGGSGTGGFTNIDMSAYVPSTSRLVYITVLHSGALDSFVFLRPDGSSITDLPYKVYSSDSGASDSVLCMECSSAQIIEYENSGAAQTTSVFTLGFIDEI